MGILRTAAGYRGASPQALDVYSRPSRAGDVAVAHRPDHRLYSPLGLEQWAKKLGAMALRKHESIACVAVMSTAGAMEGASHQSVRRTRRHLNRMADVCHAQSRRSDVVGYLGQSRFAIIAPDTDAPGAQKLIARLREALSAAGGDEGSLLRAGYCAITNVAAAAINPAELMRRAEAALQYAEVSGSADRTFSFDELPAT